MGASVGFVVVCAVVGLVACTPVEMRYVKRNADQSSAPRICSRSTTCGWELYVPHRRTVTEFVASPCACPSGTICARSSDDISISAYVNKCRPINEVENEAE